ncbi:MAG: hypothetical protein ACRCXB_33530 [Aeromonadaceae bacterium]
MSKSTRVRVSDRMVRIVRYIHLQGAKSAGELYAETGDFFPTDRAAAMCLWNMARLGVLSRGVRINGNGIVRFRLSADMDAAIKGTGVDRRMKEIAERMKVIKPRKDGG